jgi:hypothetical protein
MSMTEDYVALSIRAGVVSMAISAALKDDVPVRIARMLRWQLTPEFIEGLKKEALAKGMEQKALDDAEAFAVKIYNDKALVKRAMEMQDEMDKLYGGGKER